MPIITTLSFYGHTEAALNFYAKALQSETVFLMRFRDSPDQAHSAPGMEELIFHATFRIEGTEFMASDVGYRKDQAAGAFSGFALALALSSVDKARRVFDALRDGGKVVIPLSASVFTSWYGVVIDRFGITWKINVEN